MTTDPLAVTSTPPLPTVHPDWTCDGDGLSNSSPKFLEVMAHIQDLINSDTHHVLRPEHVAGLARLIASQIAHIDHLAPAGDDDQQALQDANEAFARRERAMADLLKKNGIVVFVTNGVPTSLQFFNPNEAEQELQDIDHLLARRSALDDLPTRNQKILHAIERAAEADRLERQWREALDAEQALSRVFVRIREAALALDMPPSEEWNLTTAIDRGITLEKVTVDHTIHTVLMWAWAEYRVRQLAAERTHYRVALERLEQQAALALVESPLP